jgi:hypothetical protein
MTDLSDFFARLRLEHAEEVEHGEHDGRCEYLRAPGLHLCHCSKRRREAAGRTALPELEFVAPDCLGCGETVECDADGFTCERCKVSWDRSGDCLGFYDEYGDLDKLIAEHAARDREPAAAAKPVRPVVDVHLPEPVGDAA